MKSSKFKLGNDFIKIIKKENRKNGMNIVHVFFIEFNPVKFANNIADIKNNKIKESGAF